MEYRNTDARIQYHSGPSGGADLFTSDHIHARRNFKHQGITKHDFCRALFYDKRSRVYPDGSDARQTTKIRRIYLLAGTRALDIYAADRPEALIWRMLRVEGPHFVAGATWKLGPCGWHCVAGRTAPILRWMADKDGKTVVQWLKRKGYSYSWSKQFTAQLQCSGAPYRAPRSRINHELAMKPIQIDPTLFEFGDLENTKKSIAKDVGILANGFLSHLAERETSIFLHKDATDGFFVEYTIGECCEFVKKIPLIDLCESYLGDMDKDWRDLADLLEHMASSLRAKHEIS